MQVTAEQVRRSLEALTTPPAPTGVIDPMSAPGGYSVGLPAGLLERLTQASGIRDDCTERARRRLETGQRPSAEALADRMLGRLVCDRLR